MKVDMLLDTETKPKKQKASLIIEWWDNLKQRCPTWKQNLKMFLLNFFFVNSGTGLNSKSEAGILKAIWHSFQLYFGNNWDNIGAKLHLSLLSPWATLVT